MDNWKVWDVKENADSLEEAETTFWKDFLLKIRTDMNVYKEW